MFIITTKYYNIGNKVVDFLICMTYLHGKIEIYA